MFDISTIYEFNVLLTSDEKRINSSVHHNNSQHQEALVDINHLFGMISNIKVPKQELVVS